MSFIVSSSFLRRKTNIVCVAKLSNVQHYTESTGHPFMTSPRRGRGSGSDGRMWTGRGQAPCGRRSTQKIKLESTDVILSSSRAKKLASFYQNFVFGRNRRWKFFGDIH